VIVETVFHWNGVGTLIYNAANKKDFPMLEAGVLVIGIAYMVATLVADILYSLLNPRIRVGGLE
jgi:peptide/nickel transport system permease protein